jgi:hypothetical protein
LAIEIQSDIDRAWLDQRQVSPDEVHERLLPETSAHPLTEPIVRRFERRHRRKPPAALRSRPLPMARLDGIRLSDCPHNGAAGLLVARVTPRLIEKVR